GNQTAILRWVRSCDDGLSIRRERLPESFDCAVHVQGGRNPRALCFSMFALLVHQFEPELCRKFSYLRAGAFLVFKAVAFNLYAMRLTICRALLFFERFENAHRG